MISKLCTSLRNYLNVWYQGLYVDETAQGGGLPPATPGEMLLETGLHILLENTVPAYIALED